MFSTQFETASVLVILFATFGAIEGNQIPPAGKCNTTNIEVVPIDFISLVKQGKWEFLYVTGRYPFDNEDHEFLDVYPLTEAVYRIFDKKQFKDNSSGAYEYTVSYADNYIIEDTVNDDGIAQRLYHYPLAITEENAILIYRCSNDGNDQIDNRFIAIPRCNRLSKEGLQKLLDVDKKYNFRGELHKLPKAFP